MKALITGISGFVGSHLADLLLKEKFILAGTVFDKKELPSNYENQIKIFEGDLQDTDFVSNLLKSTKPDTIFHLASYTSPAESFTDPTKVLVNNVLITTNLLEAVRKSVQNRPRILIVGSADEYGLVREEENPVREDTPLRPVSPYSVSKLTQDYLGLQYYLAYKLNTIRVRPGNQIGPGQRTDFVISSFAKQIVEAEKGKQQPVIKVGNLDAIRDFTDVRDMIKAYKLAVLKGKPGEVYNIGSGKGFKISDILNKLIGFSKIEVEVEVDQTRIRPLDIPKLVIDTSKFNKLTGWKPKIKIEDTLNDVLNYWRKNG